MGVSFQNGVPCHKHSAPSRHWRLHNGSPARLSSSNGRSTMNDSLSRRQLLQGLSAAALPLGAFSCAHTKPDALVVGGLPVTCNLTLPVACVAKAESNKSAPAGARRFDYQYSKYSGWPEVKESLMSGRIQAAYLLAPLAMDLADKGIPLKIVSLGHR